MIVLDLNTNEYHPYYKNYIDLAIGNELIGGLQASLNKTVTFLESIPDNKLEYRYADGKWTIKEIIQHLIDAEVVFAYRALRFARNDKTELPGFDENFYAEMSSANKKTKADLLSSYRALRLFTINLFNSFDSQTLQNIGTASNSKMSVRALGFVIIGHETHHCKVIKERYLDN
ncbi:DinB family protein [Hanstruepera ponticola]|uniref:DinB family protein n=1 Tax=Hanstruepera ponticola TaxID=2042995 RepID=UPI000CF1831B|nr:DinB family protein [Hanstruepera ponticola]